MAEFNMEGTDRKVDIDVQELKSELDRVSLSPKFATKIMDASQVRGEFDELVLEGATLSNSKLSAKEISSFAMRSRLFQDSCCAGDSESDPDYQAKRSAEEVLPGVDENEEIEAQRFLHVLEMNQMWVERVKAKNPSYFEELASNPQQPHFLWIGCSDSRVPANEITRLRAGELFVHRNIANIVVHTDLNLLSVLQYSVEILKVKHIIVAGHYGCGGVQAAMGKKDLGLIENWIRNIRDVQRLHKDELDKFEDEREKWNRIVELNVEESCLNLMKTGIIQKAWSKGVFPKIHGMVYDIREGLLRELDIDFPDMQKKYSDIYRLDYED